MEYLVTFKRQNLMSCDASVKIFCDILRSNRFLKNKPSQVFELYVFHHCVFAVDRIATETQTSSFKLAGFLLTIV